jgi:hypothetical protein
MTAETTTVSLDALDAALDAATPRLSEDEQRLAAVVLRLLSAGEPVTIPAAAAAGMPRARAEPVLRSWPGVFWDGRGRVTGMWGLALAEMPHHIRRAGIALYAWCAWDPLFLARVIGDLRSAASACPACLGSSPSSRSSPAASPPPRSPPRSPLPAS